jgi:butyrate kinase
MDMNKQREIYTIVTINPGSTSTKVGAFENDQKVFIENIYHTKEELAQFNCVQAQLMYRTKLVENACKEHDVNLSKVDAFVARGGGMASCVSGVYSVNKQLLYDCRTARTGVAHPAMLACQIAWYLESKYGGVSLVFNPPDVDEFQDVARISGIKGMYRDSHVHCLNQKEAVHRYCKEQGIRYEAHNFIVAHIGGGVSFTAHRQGKMIDSNDNLAGDGPMTPTRVGSFPTIKVIKLAHSKEYTYQELEDLMTRKGGLYSHLGTDDMCEIATRINNGDEYAKLCTDAMAYQFAKAVGSCAAVLCGQVKAIIITGGLARCDYIIDQMRPHIEWIAPIWVLPGEYELVALARGAWQALTGEREILEYNGEPVFDGFHSERYGI